MFKNACGLLFDVLIYISESFFWYIVYIYRIWQYEVFNINEFI